MSQSGPPIFPPKSGVDLRNFSRSIELSKVEIQALSAQLETVTKNLVSEARVTQVNPDGRITLSTPHGDIEINLPIQLQKGQIIKIKIIAGSPPQSVDVSIPLSKSQQAQPINLNATTTLASSSLVSAEPTDAKIFNSVTTIRPGSAIAINFTPAPMPISQVGMEKLLTTIFSTSDLSQQFSTSLNSTMKALDPSNIFSQPKLPPPILEGLQNLNLVKLALMGRTSLPLGVNINNQTETQTQTLPITGLLLKSSTLLTSQIPLLNGLNYDFNMDIEKPLSGIASLISSMIKTSQPPISKIEPPFDLTRMLLNYPPGKLLQIPNFPLAINSISGQNNSLFFGLVLGQTSVGDTFVLGSNGLGVIHHQTRPSHTVLLPGTVIVAQGQGITTQPNMMNFITPNMQTENTPSLGQFNPLMGEGWPILDEVLETLSQTDPSLFVRMRAAIPNTSNPVKLSTALLFFIAATGIGDVRAWLGDKIMDTLLRAGRSDLLNQLTTDFSAISRRAFEQTPDGWRPYMVPIFLGEELHRLQFFTRQQYHEDQENKGRVKQTRFLVNIDQTRLGDIQLDGLLQAQRLDMVLRSENEVSGEIKDGIRQHYQSALEETKLSGAIMFEQGKEYYIHPKIGVANHTGNNNLI